VKRIIKATPASPCFKQRAKSRSSRNFRIAAILPREMREEKERTKGKWENVDPVSKWYKRHAGGSRYPAAFETGYLLLGAGFRVQPE
jgi:hypothetical protein